MVDEETRQREIDGLLEASQISGCENLFIITYEEENEILANGLIIKVLPAWKWLLQART